MAGIDPRLTPLPGDRPPPAPAPAPYPPLYPPGAPPNTPGVPNPTTPVRTAVKPRNGGILKDAVGNETPFTGKGRSLTLANGQTQQVPASAWATRPEQDQRFYRDFENKLEKGTGVEYSGNTSTDKKGVSLDDWRKVLLKSVLQLGLDGVFTVLVDGKEVNVIDNYAPFNYKLCEAIHKRCTDNGEYDYYDTFKTGFISPQFHVVYDNWFQTVSSTEEVVPECWGKLVETERDNLLIDLYEEMRLDPGSHFQEPELADEWLSPDDVKQREMKRREQRLIAEARRIDSARTTAGQSQAKSKSPLPSLTDLVRHGLGSDFEAEAANVTPTQDDADDSDLPSRRLFSQEEVWRDNSTATQATQGRESSPGYVPDSPPRGSRRSTRVRFKPDVLNVDSFKGKSYMALEDNEPMPISVDHRALLDSERADTDPDTLELDDLNPVAFAAKQQSDPDNPRFHEAMRGPYREGFIDAMTDEINSLQKIQTWRVVPRSYVPAGKRVVKTMFAFKIKRYPDGTMRKLKARFCVRGDTQVAGVDYFDSYAPVVQWSTVRMMLVMSQILGLKTKQVDYTNAFAQAPLKDNEEVYIELPTGFTTDQEGDYVAKLNTSLYGMVQSPLRWFECLSKGLRKCGMEPSDHDPCLFLGENVICVVYIDDCIFFAKKNKHIDELVAKMRGQGFNLDYEDQNIAGYLGLDIKITGTGKDKIIKFTQTGLIDRLLALTGMTDCTDKDTPAIRKTLGSDPDGPGRKEAHLWSYASAIGMLLYLARNSRPDIELAVNQVARFTHSPKLSHEIAVKRICRYLKGTRDKGLTFKPTDILNMECYVDADFAGLWNSEAPENPMSVKSRTGYVITLAGCPLIWASKLQQMVALSTTESEYLALSYSMRQLLPLKALCEEVLSHLDKSFQGCKIKSTCFEDNMGCIYTAQSKKISPRTKHIATHVPFFRSHIYDKDTNPTGEIILKKIDTTEQKADPLTKPLGSIQFVKLRKMLCGW